MTDRLQMVFVESEQMEGFGIVRFQILNSDPTIYASGMVGVQMDDISGFGPGIYNLELIKIGDV